MSSLAVRSMPWQRGRPLLPALRRAFVKRGKPDVHARYATIARWIEEDEGKLPHPDGVRHALRREEARGTLGFRSVLVQPGSRRPDGKFAARRMRYWRRRETNAERRHRNAIEHQDSRRVQSLAASWRMAAGNAEAATRVSIAATPSAPPEPIATREQAAKALSMLLLGLEQPPSPATRLAPPTREPLASLGTLGERAREAQRRLDTWADATPLSAAERSGTPPDGEAGCD